MASFADAAQPYWIAHGVLMILAWGFFIPLGTLLAVYRRYVGKDGKILKNDPSFYPWHRNLQWIGFLLCMIAFGMAAAGSRRVYDTGRAFDDVLLNFQNKNIPWNRHVKLGVSVLIISGTQVLMGIIHHWLKDRHAKKEDAGPWKRPIIPSWLHVVMGFCCCCLAYVTIFQGLQIYDFIFYKLDKSPGIYAGYTIVALSGFLFLWLYIYEKMALLFCNKPKEEDADDAKEPADAADNYEEGTPVEEPKEQPAADEKPTTTSKISKDDYLEPNEGLS